MNPFIHWAEKKLRSAFGEPAPISLLAPAPVPQPSAAPAPAAPRGHHPSAEEQPMTIPSTF